MFQNVTVIDSFILNFFKIRLKKIKIKQNKGFLYTGTICNLFCTFLVLELDFSLSVSGRPDLALLPDSAVSFQVFLKIH